MKGINERVDLCRHAMRVLCVFAAVFFGLGAPVRASEIPELLESVGVKTDTAVARIEDISEITFHEASVTPHVEGLSFSVSGTVEEVHVVIGQSVRAGDVLISLDQEAMIKKADALRTRIERMKTNSAYDRQISEIDRSILELELEMLMSEKGKNSNEVALKQLDIESFDVQAELNRALYELELSGIEEELASIEKQMGENVITAPFDGCIMHVSDIQRGSYVNAFTPLVFVADDTRLFVETEYILESVLNAADRMYAHIGGGVYELKPVPKDEQVFNSKVLTGETITTDFEILDRDEGVTVGAYAMVCIEDKSVKDALVIPRNAVYTEGSLRYVYLAEDGTRIRRDVKAGTITQTLIEITEGLEEGDVVYVQE